MDPTPPSSPDPVARLGDRQLIDLAVEAQVVENVARDLGMSRATLYRRLSQLERNIKPVSA